VCGVVLGYLVGGKRAYRNLLPSGRGDIKQDGMMNAYVKIVQGEEFVATMEFMEDKFQYLPSLLSGKLRIISKPTIAVKVH
jgi:hypothetical protein